MNRWDIDEARARYRSHPFLGPATATLVGLRNAVDSHSDGWAYWQKPRRAARRLIALIEGEGRDPWEVRRDDERADATLAKLRAAYAPLKAFRTRSGLAFDIVEVDGAGAPLILAAVGR